MGSLCSKDPLSKPPFGKTKVGAHFTPCHSMSLLVTPFHSLPLNARDVSRLSGRPKLGEPTSPAWTSNCRVGFNCCCCTQNRFFCGASFTRLKSFSLCPTYVWQACVNMRGSTAHGTFLLRNGGASLHNEPGKNQNLLFSKAQKCFLLLCTLRHRSTVIACHTDCHQMPSLGCH